MRNKQQKIVELLKKAEYERRLYKKTHRFTNLSQACEKTWVAFVLALEYISKKEIKGTKAIFNIAQEQGLKQLFTECRYLHILHYEGSPDMEDFELNNYIQGANLNILSLIK